MTLPLALPPAALAQRTPITLSNLQIIAESPEQSIFSIALSPRTGSYSVDNSDPSHPALILLGTARSNDLATDREYRGLVRTIKYEPTDSGLAVRFNAGAPSKAKVEASGANGLLVTVTRLVGAEALGSRAVDTGSSDITPASGLPLAVDPLPGEDGYELVMLKYADVSEIIGLLTDGATVKPNNVFIRREPGFGSVGSTSTTTYSSSQGQTAQEEKPLGQSVDSSLAIDRRLNAIWIKGSPGESRASRIRSR